MNLIIRPNGKRCCRVCVNQWRKEQHQRERQRDYAKTETTA